MLKNSKYPNSSSYSVRVKFGQTWYGHAVAYDEAGVATKVYKLQHTSPENTGDGFGMNGGQVKVDVEKL